MGNLHEKFLKRKKELRRLLEETAARQKEAFLVLARGNRLTRYLTGYQRQTTGLTYCLGDIEARIQSANPVLLKNVIEEAETLPVIRTDYKNHLEFKKAGLALIAFINTIKKKLLQLDLLEQRCKELLISIKKALEAFYHELGIIKRKIYPYGFISRFYRFIRSLFGKTYFTPRDFGEITALGKITSLVLKIADSPVF